MSYFTDSFDEQIVSLLKNGGVGFMPSDTLYGFSALALIPESIIKIDELKGRDAHKPYIVLLSSIEQALEVGVDPKELEPVKKLWPAPLTLIVSAPDASDFLHRGLKTLAIRIPSSKSLRELIAKAGPLVSTSANLQNEEPLNDVASAKKAFGDNLDFYVDGGVISGQASTIAQLQNGQLKVIRSGAFKL